MKTLQQIFDLAMPYYVKKHFMCNSLEWACRDTVITPQERNLGWDAIDEYLKDHIFLADLIYEHFGCDKKDLLLDDFQEMGKAIYADWENREKTLESFKQQFWEIKNEN